MSDFVTKEGDSVSHMQMTLIYPTGWVGNLTGATAQIYVERTDVRLPEPAILMPATILNAAGALVGFADAGAPTLAPGIYQGEVKVTYNDGTVQRFPNDGFFTLDVIRSLA